MFVKVHNYYCFFFFFFQMALLLYSWKLDITNALNLLLITYRYYNELSAPELYSAWNTNETECLLAKPVY